MPIIGGPVTGDNPGNAGLVQGMVGPYGQGGGADENALFGLGGSNAPTINVPGLPANPTLGQALDASGQINTFNIGAQQAANAARIPNGAALQAQSSADIGSELAGQLPQDVINELGEQAAERGVSIGSPGSPNSEASLLQALGLSSLNQVQTGMSNLSGAYAENPGAPLENVDTQLVTPAQAASNALTARGQTISAEEAQANLAMEAQRNALAAAQADQLGGGGGGYGSGGGGQGYGTQTPATSTASSPAGPTASGIFGPGSGDYVYVNGQPVLASSLTASGVPGLGGPAPVNADAGTTLGFPNSFPDAGMEGYYVGTGTQGANAPFGYDEEGNLLPDEDLPTLAGGGGGGDVDDV